MSIQQLQQIFTLVLSFVSLGGSIIAGLWAYSKFIIERGLLPPVQFGIDCNEPGIKDTQRILEVLIHLKNLGSATLVARNVRVDILYLTDDSHEAKKKELKRFQDKNSERYKNRLGRLVFPNSLKDDLNLKTEDLTLTPPSHKNRRRWEVVGKRGFPVVRHDTFVQPGVNQVYSFITTLPVTADFVLLFSSFEYAQRPSLLQRTVLAASRKLGLIQYSLQHTKEPHTIERVFQLKKST
jgi:hypothetical protein